MDAFALTPLARHALYDAMGYNVIESARNVSPSSSTLTKWKTLSMVTGPSAQMTWIRDGPKSLDARNIGEAINNSLSRLRTDYIDLYQIHWPDRFVFDLSLLIVFYMSYVPMFGETEYDPTRQYAAVPIEEQLEALGTAVNAGKIRYVGVSNETPYGVMEFCRLAHQFSHYPRIVSIQNAYNLLCRNFDSGLAECCHHER
eukprot:Gb_40067 [translate_table: standard]